jgi:hypothetical protein
MDSFLDDQPSASSQKLDHSICMFKIADKLVYGRYNVGLELPSTKNEGEAKIVVMSPEP